MRLVRTNHLADQLAGYRHRDFTYREVGATRGELPAGYHHTKGRWKVGRGAAGFKRGGDIVLGWDMHRGCGMQVATDGPASEGRTVVLAVGRPIGMLIPCRVIYLVDDPNRRGFGYGTLPGHPESGEEAFIVTRDTDDSVWLEITAFTRAGSSILKLVEPISLLLQHIALRAYARSLRRQIAQ